MKTLNIIGTTPQFIKAAVFSAALSESNREVSGGGKAGLRPDKSLYLEESAEGEGVSQEQKMIKLIINHD